MMTQFVMDTDRINFTATAPVKVGDIVEVGTALQLLILLKVKLAL